MYALYISLSSELKKIQLLGLKKTVFIPIMLFKSFACYSNLNTFKFINSYGY
jgi:hypothetical protein